MKLVPNAFYIYVSDMKRSTAFYEELFDISRTFDSPGFVSYRIGDGIDLALWSGHNDALTNAGSRTSELGLAITMAPEDTDALYTTWLGLGATEVEAPHDAIFGRTFVVADPDGNLIRVAPQD